MQVHHWILYILERFSYFLEEQETNYHFSIFHGSWISCYVTSTTGEIVWLHWLLADMSVSFSYLYIVALRVLFKLLTTSFFYEMTKCIEIDCYLIRCQLQHNNLTLLFDFFFLQIADLITKSHLLLCFQFLGDELPILLAATSWVCEGILELFI